MLLWRIGGLLRGDVFVWDVRSRKVVWQSVLENHVSFLSFLGEGDRLLTDAGPGWPPMRMWDVLRGGGNELLLE